MLKYWLSVGDGQTYGPYTVEELRAFMVEGRVHAGCSLCEQTENESASSAWVPAATILSGMASLTPPTPPLHFSAQFPANSPANSSARRIGYVWSTCVTLGTLLFCCLPVGVGAVFAAARANAKYAAGDLVGGELAERSYRLWMRASIVLLVLGLVLTWYSITAAMDMLSNLNLGG